MTLYLTPVARALFDWKEWHTQFSKGIKKQICLALASACFFIALATLFRAANSFLILAFTLKINKIQKLKAMCCLYMSACVGVLRRADI